MSAFKPTIFGHHKYTLLCDKVGLAAMHYLTRLWAHCENDQRGDYWADCDATYVEQVATWKGAPGELYALLVNLRWLDELPDGGVRIHGWSEVNKGMSHIWRVTRERHAHQHYGRPKHTGSTPVEHVSHTGSTPVEHVSHTGSTPVEHVSHIGSTGASYPILSSGTSVQGRSTFIGGSKGVNPPGPPERTAAPPDPNSKSKRKARIPSHVQYAAVTAEIKELEAQESEDGRLSVENAQRLKILRSRKAEIRHKQTGT